jgi:hypothetical protein
MMFASAAPTCRPVREQPRESWLDILLAQPHLRVLLLEDPPKGSFDFRDALRGERLVLAQVISSLFRVQEHAGALRAGICLPVGSAGFVRACMRAAGIDEPRWDCYPRALTDHMLGHPRRVSVGVALQWDKPVFVKPVFGSPFHAFVLRTSRDESSSWENAQLERLLDLPRGATVWVSHVLPIAAQWRYYVLNGEVIGYAPCTPAAHTTAPSIEEVSSIVAAAPKKGAFALDVAVLRDGATSLLCVRDAWAVEWYPGSEAPRPLAFLHFLWIRWSSLLLERRQVAANSSLL